MATILPRRHVPLDMSLKQAYQEGYDAAQQDYTFQYVLTGPLIIDSRTGETYVQGEMSMPVLLSSTECRVMRVLAQHLGQLVPDRALTAAIWQTRDEQMWGEPRRPGGYVRTLISRINKRIQDAGVSTRFITSGSFAANNFGAKMLLKLPPEGEGGTDRETNIVGYSRAEVRKILENGLVHLREGRSNEAEALFQAAVNGLPDAITSAHTNLGRPNLDDRVVMALKELGAERRYVSLREISRHLRMTPPLAAKALLRARSRRSDILHRPRYGYYFEGAAGTTASRLYTTATQIQQENRREEATSI